MSIGSGGHIEDAREEATACLNRLADGDPSARDRLFEILYADLKRLAAARLRHERSDHTLQPTALVHEAWLKLIDPRSVTARSKREFLFLAAGVMRRLLVDHARTLARDKRGGNARRTGLPREIEHRDGSEDALDVEAVHVALDRLAERSERYARIVELRFFCGLSREETADALGISRAAIGRQWRTAKALLTALLREDESP